MKRTLSLLMALALVSFAVTVFAAADRRAGESADVPVKTHRIEEVPLDGEIRLRHRAVMNYRNNDIIIDLPGRTVELICDNEYLFNDSVNNMMRDDGSAYYARDKRLVVDGESATHLEGLFDETSRFCARKYESDNATVRMIIRRGNIIEGYALGCFWNLYRTRTPFYNDSMMVKAVLFKDAERVGVTEEQVNALLDKAYQELVVDAGLFDTFSEDAYITDAKELAELQAEAARHIEEAKARGDW